MTTPTPEESNYIVYSSRMEGKVGVFYFWTGTGFSGDLSSAKIHQQYGDTISTIWHGPLWEKTDLLKELGFRRLSAIRMTLAEQDIKVEWQGTQEIPIN